MPNGIKAAAARGSSRKTIQSKTSQVASEGRRPFCIRAFGLKLIGSGGTLLHSRVGEWWIGWVKSLNSRLFCHTKVWPFCDKIHVRIFGVPEKLRFRRDVFWICANNVKISQEKYLWLLWQVIDKQNENLVRNILIHYGNLQSAKQCDQALSTCGLGAEGEKCTSE